MHQIVDEESEARIQWWQITATNWSEMCKKAWQERDYLRDKCEWLEQELIKERGYV